MKILIRQKRKVIIEFKEIKLFILMSVNLKELLSKDHITNLYKLVLAKSDDGITKKEKITEELPLI